MSIQSAETGGIEQWSVAFEAEITDLLAAATLFQKRCKFGRTLRLFKLFAIVWLCSIAWIGFQARSFPKQPYVIGVGAAALWLLFAIPIKQRRSYRKLFTALAAPHATLPITLEWDTQQISFQLRGKSEARFYWSAVKGSVEDEITFLVLPSKGIFYYIPKRVLQAIELDALQKAAPKGTNGC